MIQANELRIGNYITDKWNSTYIRIESISKEGIDLEIEDDGNWPECARRWIEPSIRIDEIFGIPLTEELLLKCGAISTVKGFYHHDRFSLRWIEAYKYWYVTDMETGCYITKVEFLHEWQNTWFILQGEELKIEICKADK